jgi:hypothetical protein
MAVQKVVENRIDGDKEKSPGEDGEPYAAILFPGLFERCVGYVCGE